MVREVVLLQNICLVDPHHLFITDTISSMVGFLKFLGYIATKWVLFWCYQIFENKDSSEWNWSNVNSQESLIYTSIMLLLVPILEVIILSGPFYLALKQKGMVMILLLVLTFTLEFVIGWFATNQQLSTWMFVKMILSIGLFFLFYKKELFLK